MDTSATRNNVNDNTAPSGQNSQASGESERKVEGGVRPQEPHFGGAARESQLLPVIDKNDMNRPVFGAPAYNYHDQSRRRSSTGLQLAASHQKMWSQNKIMQENQKQQQQKMPDQKPLLPAKDANNSSPTAVNSKRHRRHQNGNKSDSRTMQRESADSDRFYEQAMRSGEYKSSLRVEPSKLEDNKQGDVGDEVNLKRSIEMKNGIALRSMNNFHKGTNAITLNNYKGNLGILWFGYDLIFTLDHLILLFNMFLTYISGVRNINEFSHIIATISISILVTGLMNILADRKWKEAADSVNSKPVEKFIFSKSNRSFQLSDWGSLQTGDILKIKQNQEVPADVLILDIFGSKAVEQTCFARGGFLDYNNNPLLKRSYKGTLTKTGANLSYSKFVDQVSGQIKWEYNHFGFFSGFFKQIDSPIAFDLQPENIMQRGCYMQNAQYAICLALNVGTQCMGNMYKEDSKERESRWKQLIKTRTHRSHFESVHFTALKYVQVASLIFCLVPCLLLILEDLVLRNFKIRQFVDTYSDADFSYTAKSFTALYSDFMQNHPYLAKLTMEAVIFFHAYFTMWDVNLVPAQLNYNELKIMKSMGQIDSVVCPKSAFFWHNACFVAAFKVKDAVFYNQNEKNERIEKENQSKHGQHNQSDGGGSQSESDDEDYRTQLDYLPNAIDFDQHFHHPDASTLLTKQNPNSEQFKELLLALVLCHHAQVSTSGKHKDSEHNYKSLYKEEEAQLYFARSFAYIMKSKKKRVLTIQNQQEVSHFSEIFIRRIMIGDEFLTVSVVKCLDKSSSGMTVYYRGPLKIIQDYLAPSLISQCEQDIEQFQKEGIHSWGVAKKHLDEEDANEFNRLLNENQLTSKNKKSKNDKLVLSLARDLKLVGIYGLQLAFNYRDSLVIEDLKKNGMKLYLLSQDAEDNVLTDCNAMNMLEGYDNPIKLEGTSDRQVEESLKVCLKECIKRRNIDLKTSSTDTHHTGPNTQSNDKATKLKYKRKKKKRQQEQLKIDTKTTKEKNAERNKQNMTDFGTLQERNVVIFDGVQLQFILTDETMKKLFMTLCNLCSLCIGSSISPHQRKFMVRAIRQFAIQGKLGNVVSVIAQQADKFTIEESDISIGLIQSYKQSDVLARTDVQMKNLYGLTYLFFKHGTLAHRRAKVVLTEFIQRTVMTQLISIFFFFINGFSYNLPYNRFFFSFFMAIQTPIQFWMEGISHVDYGYSIVHRIFGEYRSNLTTQLAFVDFLNVFIVGLIDGLIFISAYLFAGVIGWDEQVDYSNGFPLSVQSNLILNAISLSMINIFRARGVRNFVLIFSLSNYIFFFLSMITVLEDDNLVGVKALFRCPYTAAFIIFLFLFVALKHFILLVRAVVLPWNFKQSMRYQEIEDRIFMEEYEDPDKQFSIQNLDTYIHLVKTLDQNNLYSINQNLLIVHRTDSMDQILERLNQSSSRMSEGIVQSSISGIINKWNMKLHDINKELEYIMNSYHIKQAEACLPQLWTSVILFFFLLIFKTVNSWLEGSDLLEITTSFTSSSTEGSKVQTAYFEMTQIVLSILAIYMIKRIKYQRAYLLIYGLIIFMNTMCIVKFYSDRQSPLIQIQFLYTLAFSFGVRLSSFYLVSLICILSSISFLNIRLSVIQNQDEEQKNNEEEYTQDAEQEVVQNLQLTWMTFGIIAYLLLWIYYAYWDEIGRKVHFVTQYRKHKDYQKLKGIINILVPTIVRSKIQEGKKSFSDSQGDVTVVIIELCDFDKLCSKYNGKDLLDLLDKVYDGLDNFCEQYAVQKLETVGRTYVACGGLKVCESEVDPRLLGNHHSVRVSDFACSALSFIKSITLKDGKKANFRIGIHTGEAVVGIFGDTKPQFSLIGQTLTKSQVICQSAQPGKIFISQQSYNTLKSKVNSLSFSKQEIVTDIDQTMTCYSIHKRKNVKRLEKKDRLTREGKVQMAAVKDIQRSRASDEDQEQQNPFMPIQREQTQLAPQARQGDKYLAIARSSNKVDSDPMSGEIQMVSKTVEEERKPVNILEELYGETSYRSGSSSKNEGYISERDHDDVLAADSDDENTSVVNVFDGNEFDKRVFEDLRDDRAIVKKAAQNDKYKLVERPKFLMNFETREWEGRYAATQFRKHFSQEACNFVTQSVFDVLMMQGFIYSFELELSNLHIYIIVGVSHLLIKLLLVIILFKIGFRQVYYGVVVLYLSVIFSIVVFVLIGPAYKNLIYRESQLVTYALYLMIAFNCRSFQFRELSSLLLVMFIVLLTQNYWHIVQNTINIQTYIADSALIIIYGFFYLILIHGREMRSRKIYNNDRIIDVEIKRTEELLSKLVPEHVLQGIKNDQKVVDQLEHVTLLHTEITGFSEFSAKCKPAEAIALMSRLFSKFDQLCEQHGVYKLHTMGEAYVVMGYTGKVAKDRRTLDDAIIEGYNVLQVALQMLEILQEECKRLTTPFARNLELKIGIHTGKILGGIIGSKIVRYDVFGRDVLIAKKIEQRGLAGFVFASESFHNLLRRKPFIWDTFDWQEEKKIKIENSDTHVLIFRVEQIYAMDGSSSEELLDQNQVNGKDNLGVDGAAGDQQQQRDESVNDEDGGRHGGHGSDSGTNDFNDAQVQHMRQHAAASSNSPKEISGSGNNAAGMASQQPRQRQHTWAEDDFMYQ